MNEELQILANQILAQHSFDFKTFSDAKFTVTSGSLYYCFDRMSLCVYEHNLSSTAQKEVSRFLNSKLLLYSGDDRKILLEYARLFTYLNIHPELMVWQVTKKTRPDFCLMHDGISIGVEVTALTTETDELLARISEVNFGHGKTSEAIRQDAINQHGQKADQYSYLTIGGHACIRRNPFDVSSQQKHYAFKILTKYNKYHSMLSNFDKFIILCDARNTISVTSEDDAQDVVQLALASCPNMRGFTLSILYEAPDSSISCFEHTF